MAGDGYRSDPPCWWRYDATSVQDLVDGLDVQRGSLYGAFGDKHGLFLRALGRYVEDTHGATSALATDGPVLPTLRALLLGVLTVTPGRDCMLGNTAVKLAPADLAAADAVRAGFALIEDGFRAVLERGRVSGELPARADAGAQARMLIALLEGLHVLAQTERDPGRLNDAVERRPRRAPLTRSADALR